MSGTIFTRLEAIESRLSGLGRVEDMLTILCDELGVSEKPTPARRKVRRKGTRRNVWTAEQEKELVDLRSKGISFIEIGKALSRTGKAVQIRHSQISRGKTPHSRATA